MHHPSILNRPTTNLRLTRRGRFVVRILLICGLLGVLAVLLAALAFQQPLSPAVAADEQTAGVYQQVVVQPGDTLWEISSRLARDDNQAAVLKQIMAYNALETSKLEVGQTLYIPLYEN